MRYIVYRHLCHMPLDFHACALCYTIYTHEKWLEDHGFWEINAYTDIRIYVVHICTKNKSRVSMHAIQHIKLQCTHAGMVLFA